LKRLLKSTLVAMTSNRLGQSCVSKVASIAQFLMGIGSGSDVEGSGESAVFRVLNPVDDRRLVVFDVGANLGQFLAVARRQLRDRDVTFHCFEPGATGYAAVKEQYASCSNVVLNKMAVGREAGHGDLWYDSPGSGLASLTRRDLEHFGIGFDQSEPVEITTVDSYCGTHEIERIDLLKMDIEGHEYDALQGAAATFARGAVGAVMFEFGGCNIDTRTFFRDFWRFFERHNMRVFRVTPGGYLHPIPRYLESLEQFRTTNFLAVADPQA
jgi:FkbM family methyltransferase